MKNVLITGGSRGIGASTALKCARLSYRVILTWNSQPEAAIRLVERIEAEGGWINAQTIEVAGGYNI